jgi:trans-aconitate methyltransferase
MELTRATDLLTHPAFTPAAAEQWADLGCGNGTFTQALASLLPPGSHIDALDTDAAALQQVPPRYAGTTITTHRLNFVTQALPFGRLNGLLMANSLHYVQHQPAFIQKVIQHLVPGGRMLLVEYNTNKANPWVPYPVAFDTLKQLLLQAGFASVTRMHEMPSRYQQAKLYTAVAVWE